MLVSNKLWLVENVSSLRCIIAYFGIWLQFGMIIFVQWINPWISQKYIELLPISDDFDQVKIIGDTYLRTFPSQQIDLT